VKNKDEVNSLDARRHLLMRANHNQDIVDEVNAKCIVKKSLISIFFTVPFFFIATMFTACIQVEYKVNVEIDLAGAGYIAGTGTYQEG